MTPSPLVSVKTHSSCLSQAQASPLPNRHTPLLQDTGPNTQPQRLTGSSAERGFAFARKAAPPPPPAGCDMGRHWGRAFSSSLISWISLSMFVWRGNHLAIPPDQGHLKGRLIFPLRFQVVGFQSTSLFCGTELNANKKRPPVTPTLWPNQVLCL